MLKIVQCIWRPHILFQSITLRLAVLESKNACNVNASEETYLIGVRGTLNQPNYVRPSRRDPWPTVYIHWHDDYRHMKQLKMFIPCEIISLSLALSSVLPTLFRNACCFLFCQGTSPWKWRLTSTLRKKTWCSTKFTSRNTTTSG